MIDLIILAFTHVFAFAAGALAWRELEKIKRQAEEAAREAEEEPDEDIEADHDRRNRLGIQALRDKQVQLKSKPINNREEMEIYHHLRGVITKRNDWRQNIKFSIHAQPGMASVLEVKRSRNPALDTNEKRAKDGILLKRFDFLIVDGEHKPVVAIEYQGRGHHVGTTSDAKDKLKRLACERVRLPLIIINDGETPHSYSKRVKDVLDAKVDGRELKPRRFKRRARY